MRLLAAVLTGLLFIACSKQKTQPASGGEYVSATVCTGCHAEIARTYRDTGMGRSFYAPRDLKPHLTKMPFQHRASGESYEMIESGGRLVQRRTSTQGVFEKAVDFVVGSGNHTRTYLYRGAGGQLFQMPLSWYSDNGGYWAMSPGYDKADHRGFRRTISDDCMSCHNGYPRISEGDRKHGADAAFPGKLPEGIDCQRCHGPGGSHVAAAGAQRPKEEIRRGIFNPARQNRERQMEVCMQCHLESTSRALPYAIARFDRDPFSYKPSEPLSAFILHFDFAPGKAPDDHFEIAHAAYRLRKSACFLKSGTMTCTTCHNPHRVLRGQDAVVKYRQTCLGCHAQAHNREAGCVSCHMPKRRTDDVVHVVMTDHFIRKKQPARNLLAPLAEQHESESTAYRGAVTLYYPARLPDGAVEELYGATAQVYAGANFAEGLPRLERALERHTPPEPEFYHQLAEAYYRTGKHEAAAAWYRKALEKDSRYLPAIRNLGATLTRLGRFSDAAEILRRAPADPISLNNLGEALLASGQAAAAVSELRRALELDPDSPEALNNLGRALARSGDRQAAEASYRTALRVNPTFALAHNNLAIHLDAGGRWEDARRHFEEALKDRSYALARFNYGTALAGRGDLAEAERQLTDAVRLDPMLADAHLNLGNIEAARGRLDRAANHFSNALKAKPGFGRARINLGLALADLGRAAEAAGHLQAALIDPDPGIRDLAQRALQQIRTTK
jgi:Tfp pilus assembly protein PilF